MSKCEHGFVVRDVQGNNRFLCRECDERFLSYPQKQDPWDPIKEAMKVYEAGFVEKMNEPGFVFTKGAYVNQVTYTLPVSDKVTQTFQFVENNDE